MRMDANNSSSSVKVSMMEMMKLVSALSQSQYVVIMVGEIITNRSRYTEERFCAQQYAAH